MSDEIKAPEAPEAPAAAPPAAPEVSYDKRDIADLPNPALAHRKR